MGISLRYFLVDDADVLHRVSLAMIQRLHYERERLPRFAGKRARLVEVIVTTEARRPVGILRIAYAFMRFDGRGALHPSEKILQPISIETDVRKFGALLDARQRFAEKRRRDKRRWQPTPDLEKAITVAVIGNRKE